MAFIPLIVPPVAFAAARWFVFQNGRLLVDTESADIPRLADPSQLGLTVQRSVFLGSLHGEPSFAAEVKADSPAPDGMVWEGLRALFMRYDDPLIAAAGRAVQLVDWDRPPVLRALWHAHLKPRARAGPRMPELWSGRLSPHFSGHDGASEARSPTAARARPALP